MTIAILILVLINTAAIAYLTTVIFEIRDGVQSYYPSLVKIMAEQRDVIQGTLDSINRWSDLCEDIIDHIERVEDMEGDIKDIFEWIHSIDDNVANMRMDIQKILDKFDEDAYNYINASIKKDKDENNNSVYHSMDYAALYDKLVSRQPPYNTYLDDQKGDDNV